MPLKRVALDVADEVTPDTAAIGAANTLVRCGGEGRASIAGSVSDRGAEPGREPTIPRGPGWLAVNTDVAGVERSLRAVGVASVQRGGVMGAGGTAQAALAALRLLGETAPTVLVRDPARTGPLRATAERLGVAPRIVGGFPETPLPQADVVISTVPAGAADALAAVAWDPATVLLDVIYAPWPTTPAAAAAAAGCRVAGGLEVLLHQAVGQVELMTGRPGPTEAMATALMAAAGERRP
jgi:shikimate dehydrogenase